MHIRFTNCKTIFPGLYLGLVAAGLLTSVPAIFSDKFSYCSGAPLTACLPYGIIAIIFLHLPLVFLLQPVLNYVDSRNIYPSLAVLFFTFFLLNLMLTLVTGALLDLILFRKPKSSPDSSSSVINPLHTL